MGKIQWVVPHNGHWAVRGADNSKVTKIFQTKSAALKFGKKIATNQHSDLIGLKRNGQINLRNSYGKDPCPPKDKD